MLSLIEDDHDQREHGRRRVLLAAQLHTSSTVYKVRIRDISGGGARIEGDDLPRPGVVVCLQRAGRMAYGVMAWASGNAGGITFDEPVAEDYFGGDQLPRVDSAAMAAPYRRPGFGRPGTGTLYSTGDGWIDPAAVPLKR
jgi:hypothetical protein